MPQSETLHPRLTSNLVRVGAAIQHNPKGTVKRMHIFLRILTLAALSVASTLSALAQNPDTDLPAVPNQATLRTMRGNSLSQDPLYGGYWGSGCCFCPAQPVSSAPAVAPPASSTTSAAGQPRKPLPLSFRAVRACALPSFRKSHRRRLRSEIPSRCASLRTSNRVTPWSFRKGRLLTAPSRSSTTQAQEAFPACWPSS